MLKKNSLFYCCFLPIFVLVLSSFVFCLVVLCVLDSILNLFGVVHLMCLCLLSCYFNLCLILLNSYLFVLILGLGSKKKKKNRAQKEKERKKVRVVQAKTKKGENNEKNSCKICTFQKALRLCLKIPIAQPKTKKKKV